MFSPVINNVTETATNSGSKDKKREKGSLSHAVSLKTGSQSRCRRSTLLFLSFLFAISGMLAYNLTVTTRLLILTAAQLGLEKNEKLMLPVASGTLRNAFPETPQ